MTSSRRASPCTRYQKHSRMLSVRPSALISSTYGSTLFAFIQDDDDNEDWQREASTMSDVYAGSSLNIAATAAENGRIGCFFQRDQRTLERIRPCVLKLRYQATQQAVYILLDPHKWKLEIDQSPLAKRAWVLQERFLAPRTLHFGASQIYWECSKLVACESFPFGMPLEGLVFGNEIAQAKCFVIREGQKQDEKYWNQFSTFWQNIVSHYSQARLTNEEDKLVAISGVARFCHNRTGDQYIAGLWKRNLHHHLLWFGVRHVEPSATAATSLKKYIAPTWSWASSNRPVLFYSNFGRSMFSTLELRVIPLAQDPFGQLKAASLRIKCTQLRAPLLPLSKVNGEFQYRVWLVKHYCLKFDADPPDNPDHVYMLPILDVKVPDLQILQGLLRTPTPQKRP